MNEEEKKKENEENDIKELKKNEKNNEKKEKEEEKISSTKLKDDMEFIPYNLLISTVLKESDIDKEIVEEENSELFYETLNGIGTAIFSKLKYKGNLRFGVLDSRIEKNEKKKDDQLKIAKIESSNSINYLFNIENELEQEKKNKNKKKKENLIESTSEIYFKDGTIYKGTIHNNIIEGYGTFLFPTGSKYIGELKKGLRDGKGIYENEKNKIYYNGQWKNGLKNGKGILKKDNLIYDGEWVNGIINGFGNIKWLKSNNTYEGYFKNSLLNGNGFMIWNDVNEKYVGQWENNLQNGIGVHIYFENKGEFKMFRNRYFGEWKNGKRNGYGIFYYSNGSFYEGFWENDKKNGFGIMNFIDRNQFIGNFCNDRMTNSIEELSNDLFSNNSNSNFNVNSIVNSSVSNFSKTKKNSFFKKTGQSLFRKSNSVKSIFEKKIEKNTVDGSILNDTINSKEKMIIDKFNTSKLYIDISDILLLNPEINDKLILLDNIILRNISDLMHWYNIIIGRENIKDNEVGTSFATNTNNDTKSILNNQSIPKLPINHLVQINKENEEKNKELNLINPDVALNNDLKFCMELSQLWLFLRDGIGIINIDFSIVDFDRIFFNGPKNYIEMFYIPPNIINNNDEIYKYLYASFKKQKHDFISNYYKFIPCQQPQPFNEGKKIIKDIHNKKQVILQRGFHEVFIRIAFFRYILNIKSENELIFYNLNNNNNVNQSFEIKYNSLESSLSSLLSYIKPFYLNKKKISASKSNLSDITSKTQNINSVKKEFDNFINYYESTLYKMFNKLYFVSTNHPNFQDKTITYDFFYRKILLKIKDEKLLNIFKYRSDYCEIILSIPSKCIVPQIMTIGKKNIVIVKEDEKSINSFKENNTQLSIKYYKSLYNEMISYEFNELIFQICRKYSEVNQDFSKDFSFNQVIISIYEIIQKLYENKTNKKNDLSIKNIYFYPKLKSHLIIEQIEINKKKEEEEKMKKEIEYKRMMKERENLKNEDINVYFERGENDSEDYDDDML